MFWIISGYRMRRFDDLLPEMDLHAENADDILYVIVSGKRPKAKDRKTETLQILAKRKTVIISNNSDGYHDTRYPILDVPQEFRDEFAKYCITKFGGMVPMNKQFAVEFARARGFRFLAILDDNILSSPNRWFEQLKPFDHEQDEIAMTERFERCARLILRNTNAGVVGAELSNIHLPGAYNTLLSEGRPYSYVFLDLEKDLPIQFGDVEEDIIFCDNCWRKNIATVVLRWITYGKTSQGTGVKEQRYRDTSGNRSEYDAMTGARGENASKIIGLAHGMRTTRRATPGKRQYQYKHTLPPVKKCLVYFSRDFVDEMRKEYHEALKTHYTRAELCYANNSDDNSD